MTVWAAYVSPGGNPGTGPAAQLLSLLVPAAVLVSKPKGSLMMAPSLSLPRLPGLGGSFA